MKHQISTHKEFLKNKDKLIDLFEKAIYNQLIKMGSDIKGITFFSSTADTYKGNDNA